MDLPSKVCPSHKGDHLSWRHYFAVLGINGSSEQYIDTTQEIDVYSAKKLPEIVEKVQSELAKGVASQHFTATAIAGQAVPPSQIGMSEAASMSKPLKRVSTHALDSNSALAGLLEQLDESPEIWVAFRSVLSSKARDRLKGHLRSSQTMRHLADQL